MKRFAELFEQIDQTQSTNEKVEHIKNYFENCSDEDGAWTLFFLSGHRVKRLITSRLLLTWCTKIVPLPDWLIEESYSAVGDTAETISLLLPRKVIGSENKYSLSEWMEKRILPLKGQSVDTQESHILSYWDELSTKEIFILNKILTGAFRVGVSSLLTLKGLSNALDIPREILSQRVMGNWEPTGTFFKDLRSKDLDTKRYLNPYPFYLAYPFEDELKNLGPREEWLAEWKWDGIRAQAVLRDGTSALWSRGNELISNQFPELIEAFTFLPEGMVLDGEILAFHEGQPLPFGELQKRLGRKNVSKAMTEKTPIVFMVYDILEYENKDLRKTTLIERRALLDSLKFSSTKIIKSSPLEGKDWDTLFNLRLKSREHATEGLMLKKWDSVYGVGRQKGSWWKYKVDAMTLDAVLMYAQAGSGRRANLFTDYTFGVWKEGELIPIAKAYSGLDQKEINELDNWIRKNTEEKFGPVRKVKAGQVFEIAFEGIQISKRHKSGIALRFPRIVRWRKDKPMEECDTLDIIKETFFHDK